ncbi:MAG: hypothetical protein JXA30_14680 [Deltaproteobacteria bacterium]|nr:hypothetical protein [Deltaproteobacteria bacterium]
MKLHRPIGLLLFLSILSAVVMAWGKGSSDYIDVDEIHPGMRGYGLTVFQGTQPERFEVEVIDVLRNFRPDQDLILIRSEHPVFRRAATIAGMSGSPIYLNGKLAGAYAYGWLFGKEPIAGVTPAANMLAEINRPVDPNIWRALGIIPKAGGLKSDKTRGDRRASLAGLPPYWGTKRRGAFGTLREHAARVGLLDNPTEDPARGLTPIATPLLLSGVSPAVIDTIGRELERFGLVALQASGGTRQPPKARPSQNARFVNGGAIGVQLIRGDISATAIGTVTHVADKRLIAFGHPMMNIGQIAWPTSTARVLHVLASERRSFKIAEAIAPLGTLIHDRQAAIIVDTEMRADTVPVTVRVEGLKQAPRSHWNMEVVNHRLITPILTFAAIASALNATSSDRSHVVYSAKSRVAIKGQGVINLEDIGYTPAGITDSMALSDLRLFDLMDAAYGNPFEESRIESVEVELDLSFVRDVVTVQEASVSCDEVDPGSRVELRITLRPFAKPQSVRTVQVLIPHSAAGEEIELVIEPGNEVAVEQPQPDNLSQIIDSVVAGYPATALVVSTRLPSPGLKLRGHVVRQLPGSAYDTLQLVNQSERVDSFATLRRKVVPIGQVVSGSARLKLKVRELARNQE